MLATNCIRRRRWWKTPGGRGGEAALVNEDYAKLTNWNEELWRFADLNEPVIRGDRIYYPIVDPRARDFPKWDDAREFDDAGVEGFDWHTDGVADSPMREPLAERGYEALPMPTEWIYQLEDGTLGHLNDSREFVAFGSGGSATKDNPIIGRFAFWADDETCKSNVNTHAGGTAWDTPRAGGDIDRNLGRYQPAQREFQRYKGHPATTNLAPVLFPGMKNITRNRNEMEKIYRIVPRYVGGGSASGTKLVNENDPKESNGLIPDKDRLYPSLDDFILRPGGDRGLDHTNPDISFGTRIENEFPALSAGQRPERNARAGALFPDRDEPCAGGEPVQHAAGQHLADLLCHQRRRGRNATHAVRPGDPSLRPARREQRRSASLLLSASRRGQRHRRLGRNPPQPGNFRLSRRTDFATGSGDTAHRSTTSSARKTASSC